MARKEAFVARCVISTSRYTTIPWHWTAQVENGSGTKDPGEETTRSEARVTDIGHQVRGEEERQTISSLEWDKKFLQRPGECDSCPILFSLEY
jgi:hypothetical protein